MNSAPWAKLTTPSMPNTMVRPSAVITSTAPGAMPENSCMMIRERSMRSGSGRVAEFATAAQHLVGAGIAGHDREQVAVIGHGRLLLRFQHKHRLHRLVLAFAVMLRAIGQAILQSLHPRDNLFALTAAGRPHRHQQRADTRIAIGAVIRR